MQILGNLPSLSQYGAGLKDKKTLLRLDLNVPLIDGKVGDATRIERSLPSVKFLLDAGARVAILSHLGRPKGNVVPELSLAPLVSALHEHGLENIRPTVVSEWDKAADALQGDYRLVLVENLRFSPGEEEDSPDFAAALAKGFDLYVNDAFSCAHRAHASVHALARLLPAYAGFNLEAEVAALESALENPKRPVMAIVGGAKVSTKLSILTHLITRLDYLAIGGGMANSFLAAQGVEVGASLCERDQLDVARNVLESAKKAGCEILLPSDVVLGKNLAADQPRRQVRLGDSQTPQKQMIKEDDMILDIGDETIAHLGEKLRACRTLLWNGPLGVFETPPFDEGTNRLAMLAAEQTKKGDLMSIAGGGDTLAALNHALKTDDPMPGDPMMGMSYVSTAGGAFLEWLEGRPLPGIEILRQSPSGH